MQMKVCSKCGIEKEISEFNKGKFGKYGVTGGCSECLRNEYNKNKDRYIENRHKKIENIPNFYKIKYQKNKESIKATQKRYRENLKKDKVKYSEFLLKDKNRKLLLNFNISLNDYNKMLEAQNGVCAICGRPEMVVDNKKHRIKDLSVDHNHKTNKIRGLLCQKCNHLIGLANENLNILLSAINYLKTRN
jgi:hypothetical protein